MKKIIKYCGLVLGSFVLLLGTLAVLKPEVLEIIYILYENTQIITHFEVRENEVIMNGEINSQTYNQFEILIEKNPQVNTLVQEMVPGSMDDETMIKLAYFVREQGLNTKLKPYSQIDSGGVDLFLAGVERIIEISPDGLFPHIGVHSWSDGLRQASDFDKNAPEHEKNRKYIEDMLGDDSFYWFTIYAAPADDIYEMTVDEIKQYQLPTKLKQV